MSATLALALAAGAVVPADGHPLIFHGECIYSPGVAEALPDAVRFDCDTVEVTTDGVDFERSGWDVHSRFFGTWQGAILTVTAIQPRGAKRHAAKGSCRVEEANGRVSMISCSAFGSGRGWLGNFRNVPP